MKMMGNMKVFLVFDSVQSMDVALASDLLRKHFLEIRRWLSGEANRTRLCWIGITGLLIHGWSKENMIKIGAVWGRVVEIEDEKRGHLSAFKVEIVAIAGPTIRALENVVIAGAPINARFAATRSSRHPLHVHHTCNWQVMILNAFEHGNRSP
ncbi:hypothetical protein PIB30_025968 [Stylosanthes scabra]|uniref:DUF4283 domain-containing protein n=1 Tax=Stylosanthes scabra TaxID=79078 RepID=A0ABU6SAA3_9FABA|nr:hypothetical protein [Stylosanthes scabra]